VNAFYVFSSSMIFLVLFDYWKACMTVANMEVSEESSLKLADSFSISFSSSLILLSFSPT